MMRAIKQISHLMYYAQGFTCDQNIRYFVNITLHFLIFTHKYLYFQNLTLNYNLKTHTKTMSIYLKI